MPTMSESETPRFRYTAVLAGEIEPRWQDYWAANGTFYAPNPAGPLADPDHPRAGAPKLHVQDMFPYPSGAGLHVGHPLGYIGTTATRVISGWPASTCCTRWASTLRAARRAVRGADRHPPAYHHEANIERYRGQLRRLGLAYDDRRTFSTTDPDYYRWTQWIFLQVFNSWYTRRCARRARSRP